MTGATARRILAVLLGTGLLLAACGGSPAPESPGAAVRQVLREIDEGDLDGVLALTCATQRDALRTQFDFSDLGSTTGLDLAPLFEALNVGTSNLAIDTANVDGDHASVRIIGTIDFSFDATRLRELFRGILDQQGVTVPDERLESMLLALEGTRQAMPVDQLLDVVREDGAWKLCSRLTLLP
jgi:hypothetical protein